MGLTLKDASEIANSLSRVFADVLVLGADEPVTVRARGHNHFAPKTRRCPHTMVRTARHVTAAMYYDKHADERYLRAPDEHHPLLRFASVATCCACDAVTGYAEADVRLTFADLLLAKQAA